MKLVTYNMRCDVPVDGINRFSSRKGLVIDKIETEKPDVIGFQEITPAMNEYLKQNLKSYTMVGCGRGMDYHDEHNPVAFRSDKYELIALDVTWLSPMPYEPGSRFEEQSPCPRIITHVILRPLGNAEPFQIYNTHLDHVSSLARELGLKRLLEKIEADQITHPFPAAVTGDFNACPSDSEMKLIMNGDSGFENQTENLMTTYHNRGRHEGEQIDYIFTRGFKREYGPVKWTDQWNGIYLSDHYPIEISLSRKDGGKL